jgi:formylglycine-generating enzyme
MSSHDKMDSEKAAELLQCRKDNIEHLADIPVEVEMELGRKEMMLSQVREIGLQDVIELDKQAGEAFEIRVNGHPFASGEVVVVTDLVACRVTSLQRPVTDLIPASPPEKRGSEQVFSEYGMVYIPAGPFIMGGRDEDSPRNERPAHSVVLSAYFIGQYPVTNLDFYEFVENTGHKPPIHWSKGTYPPDLGYHPVVNVTWRDAQEYAEWRGARLPTEAEREKAARGTDERHYPWGNRFVDGERCNGNNAIGATTPVNEFPYGRSPYGVWDMCGNVYEWCADYYDEDYYKVGPGANPKGPDGGQERVVRGGSFGETRAALRVTHREGVKEVASRETIGFRIAMDA